MDTSTSGGPPRHLRPSGRWRRRFRRGLRVTMLAVVATLVLLAVWAALLVLTNPDPVDRPGWERVADLPSGRGEVASTVAADRLVIVGGIFGPGRTSDAAATYDPARDAWAGLPALPSPRHHAAAAAIGGTVYVTGGARSSLDWGPRRTAWALEPGADAWTAIEPMPEGRLGHDVVALDGRLYVVGGEGPSSDVLVYDPGEGWRRGAALGQRPDHVRAVELDGEVWLLGGRNGGMTDLVVIYDPDRDAWRPGPRLPVRTSAMAVGVLEGAIHVVGGEDPRLLGGRVDDHHLVLEPGAEVWIELGPPMLAVHGAGYGVLDGSLVIAGGARRQGGLSILSWTGVTQRYAPAG